MSEEIFSIWIKYKFALLLLSFLFLFYFGFKSLLIISEAKISRLVKVVLIFVMTLIALPTYFYSYQINNDSLIRYVFGFPSATLSGLVFLILSYRYAKKNIVSHKNLLICGYLFIGYGIFSGIITSDFLIDKLTVIFLRGTLAIFIFIFLFRFLKVFDDEYIKNLEENLNKSALNDRLSSIGKLAMGIAHEINTSLTNATMVIEILKSKAESNNPKIVEKLNSLEKNIDRLPKLQKSCYSSLKPKKLKCLKQLRFQILLKISCFL